MNFASKSLGLLLFFAMSTFGLSAYAAEDTSKEEPDEMTEAAPKAKAKKAKAKGKRSQEGQWVFKLDALRASVGGYTDDPGPTSNVDFYAAASARMQKGNWEFALGGRIDAQVQDGDPDFSRAKLDYTDNYVRWRNEEMRLTIGTQTVLWGRVDEISPIDRLSRVDLTRLVLDKQPERRRAVPAIRMEQFFGDYKLDAVWLPVFDAAMLPHRDSAWHPVDTTSGRIVGIGTLPMTIGFQVREDEHGSGGGGLRLTRTGGDLDYGMSVQRVRLSLPYYRLGAGVLTGVHPYSWVVGGELETQKAGATWRAELAWSSDIPVTNLLGQMGSETGWDLVLGSEFFPGDAETRVTLQLAGHKTNTDGQTLDRDDWYALTGEVEHPFAEGRWRINARFSAGLDERDTYFNPKLTYLGIDQHEFFLAAHLFSGEDKTLSGYYRDKDLIEIGWRAKF
jgi:hypothetical protein